jgi:hypothetical protein
MFFLWCNFSSNLHCIFGNSNSSLVSITVSGVSDYGQQRTRRDEWQREKQAQLGRQQTDTDKQTRIFIFFFLSFYPILFLSFCLAVAGVFFMSCVCLILLIFFLSVSRLSALCVCVSCDDIMCNHHHHLLFDALLSTSRHVYFRYRQNTSDRSHHNRLQLLFNEWSE